MLLLLILIVFAESVDCPNLRVLAQGLGMESAQPSIWTELQGDCCYANGVYCVGGLVIGIYWSSKGLNGGTINGTAIPSDLRDLDLPYNQLTGIFPTALPTKLVHLYLHNNQLSGTIPATLPAGLIDFSVHNNSLSGDLPFFPSTLQRLWLGWPGIPGNYFTGNLNLYKPYELWINDNLITDILVTDSSQLVAGKCDLSNNPLLGNPHLANLGMCTQNRLYSVKLLANTNITGTTTKATGLMPTTLQIFQTSAMTSSQVWFSGSAILMLMSGAQTAKAMIRIFISTLLLGSVLTKLPIKREWKARTRRDKGISQNASEFEVN